MTVERPPGSAATAPLGNARAAGDGGCHPDLYPGALRSMTGYKAAIAPFVKTHPLSGIDRVCSGPRAHASPYRLVGVPDGR